MSSSSMDTALVLKQVSDSSLDNIKKAFKTVHYFPSSTEKLTDEILSKVQVIFSTYAGPPSDIIPSFEKTPELQFVQIPSAGADRAGQASAFKKQSESSKDEQRVKLCNSSGIHVTSIPQWTVAMTINLLHQIQKAIIHGHSQKTWAKKEIQGPFGEETYYARDIVGLTVGLLGYGTLARETARLFQPFGVKIIAANSSGKASKDTGYIMPGTGDEDGSIPSTYYATTDPDSFKEFLGKTDVLICSLPSTSKTRYLLDAEKLSFLPKGALFLNVGRGDLVRSDDLLKALDQNISGAAMDVTDPEPLTDDHPLFSHPNVIITPHISGNTQKESQHAVDLLLYNVERIRKGEDLVNVVDLEKGY